jgi:hypothetical protein
MNKNVFLSMLWDPGSRIPKQQQKRGLKKISCHSFFCSHKFHKIDNYFSFEMLKKKFGSIFKELYNFLPKKLLLSYQNYGFGIRDPESEILDPGSRKNLFRIPDPGVQKAPDPGSGSATLVSFNEVHA